MEKTNEIESRLVASAESEPMTEERLREIEGSCVALVLHWCCTGRFGKGLTPQRVVVSFCQITRYGVGVHSSVG